VCHLVPPVEELSEEFAARLSKNFSFSSISRDSEGHKTASQGSVQLNGRRGECI
jgi:hypothetical protein